MGGIIKYRLKTRLSQVSISVAFILSSTPFILAEGNMPLIVGSIFLFIGLSYILWIILYPLHDEIPPVEYCFKNSKIIWGSWNTGDEVTRKGLVEKYNSSIKRILLMNPESEAFRKNLEITSDSKPLAKEEIIRLTKLAKQKGITVRWYDKLQRSAITFYDPVETCGETLEPNSKKAWCILRELKPNVPREHRPVYKIEKKNNAQQFEHQLSVYKDMWDNDSREPPKEAYIE